MAKIRRTMIVSYVIIICLMFGLVIFFNILHTNAEAKYASITNTLILENGISQKTSKLVALHLSLLQDINNPELTSEYNVTKQSISMDLEKLDVLITSNESVLVYIKLKTIIEKLEDESAQGIQNTRNKDFTKSDYTYNYILQDESYIKETTANLVVAELNYAAQIQKNMDNIRNITFFVGATLVLIIILFCGIIAYYFSNKLSSPLVKLSGLAKEISGGNISQRVDKNLMEYKDEIGSLANSFDNMLVRLNSEITSQKAANDSLLKTETKLGEVNINLEKANLNLKSLDSQKDEFISLTAHELKTPLTSIRGFTQIMLEKDKWGDADNKHYLELINKNTDRLYTLVTDIVDSSRISLGKLKLNIEEVDTYKLFNEIKENMTLVISGKGLAPIFIIDKKLPNIMADFERTMQILHNLISNSVKFTEHGRISLHVSRYDDFIRFEVLDTGQGIPKENFNSIFSKFYQVDSSMTRKIGGSGLGLSICKGLVEGMGGKIGFNSELGKGSIFAFILPIVNNKQKADNKNNNS